MDMFTAGLIEALRVDVEMQYPPNLVTAMNLAWVFERKIQINKGVGVPRSLSTWATSKTTAIMMDSNPPNLNYNQPTLNSQEQKSGEIGRAHV